MSSLFKPMPPEIHGIYERLTLRPEDAWDENSPEALALMSSFAMAWHFPDMQRALRPIIEQSLMLDEMDQELGYFLVKSQWVEPPEK